MTYFIIAFLIGVIFQDDIDPLSALIFPLIFVVWIIYKNKIKK